MSHTRRRFIAAALFAPIAVWWAQRSRPVKEGKWVRGDPVTKKSVLKPGLRLVVRDNRLWVHDMHTDGLFPTIFVSELT